MILGFIFITNQINCYIFYTAAVNGLGIKLSKDKVKPEGSQLSPCYQYQAIFIKDRFLVNGDILPATVLSNKENKSTSLNVRLLCSLFDFKKMASPNRVGEYFHRTCKHPAKRHTCLSRYDGGLPGSPPSD